MDLEVVGRHALLFDDDANAAFVNSSDALVEWHSLQIDRYDVRHLLPAPPPSRLRSRNSETIQSDDPSLQSQLDYERYLDLILQPDQPGIEEDENPLDTGGYRAVAFSYGNNNDSADQDNAAVGWESSAFHPPFPIPGDLQSLPQTEKMHQIIARTAIFVSKHGGQSEIILRVKQGDNPTFGFLMPDHQLHPYFRYLVEHPDLLNSEFDGRTQNKEEKVGGALSLLGSVYGSGEEEESDDIAKTENGVEDKVGIVNHSVSHGSYKVESKADSNKDESVSRNSILSNTENTVVVKKNSMVTALKSGSVEGIKKDVKSGTGKAKNSAMEEVTSSKVEPLILEPPPPELKRIIDKLVEFIVRNGKQFEATLIEQDSKDVRFPFLLPSNQHHSYYLKVLQSAQQSKANGRSTSFSGKANNNLSSLPSAASYLPLEIDRKERFKMAIGKSKEAESKGYEPVDAETAAAILQAATRGIKTSNIQMMSSTTSNSQGNHVSGLPKSQLDNSAGCYEEQLTEVQKLKAERLKRAKMFVAMLKSGTVPPHKQGTSRSSSVEPLHSVGTADVNLNGKEREGSLAPDTLDSPTTIEKPEERNYFDEHSEPLSKRTYRPRSVKCEEEEEDNDEDQKEHNDRLSRRKHRSRRSRRYDEHEYSMETEEKHHKKRHRSRSRSRSRSSSEEEHHKRSRKKHHESSRKRRSSKQHSHSDSEEEDKHDSKERDNKGSSKKHHRSHRSSSHRSKDKRNRHKDERSSKRKHHHDDEHHRKRGLLHGDGNELEEGEITSKAASGQSRDIASGHVSREPSSQPAEAFSEVPNDLRAKVRAMLMATHLS